MTQVKVTCVYVVAFNVNGGGASLYWSPDKRNGYANRLEKAVTGVRGGVSCGDSPAPLILRGDRLCLNRMWCNERTVARFLTKLTVPSP